MHLRELVINPLIREYSTAEDPSFAGVCNGFFDDTLHRTHTAAATNTRSISQALEAVASNLCNDVIVLFVGLMHSIATAFTDAVPQVRERLSRPIVVIWKVD